MIDGLYERYQRAIGALSDRHRWSDWSDQAFAERRHIIHDTEQRLELLRAQKSLAALTQLDAALLARELRLDREDIEFRCHAFPVNQLMGVPNQMTDGLRIPFFLTTRQRLETIDDAEHYIDLVIESESHLLQIAASLRAAAHRGITPPREALRATRRVISDSLRGIPVTGSSGTHPIYQRFVAWAAGCEVPAAGTLRNLPDRLATALAGPFRRGYAAIDAALEDMLDGCRTTFGVWDLPGGAEFYRHCLERWSGTSTSADSLHSLGIAEIGRIQDEIRPLLAVDHRHLPLPDVAELMRRDVDGCYATDAAGAAEYLGRAQMLASLALERLDGITSWSPRAGLEICAVEPERQSGALYAEFYPASVDGVQPSRYYVNTGDMSRLPKSELAALTFHESVPGHHVQLCTTQEREDLSAFRRRPFLYESYCEGWAMYAEQLGCELLADVIAPQEQLGCLTRRLWMAARVAVDTGIHAQRWTRNAAIRFFEANTFAPQQMIEQEVDRLSVWPAQATAYHVGYLAFSKLRAETIGARGAGSATRDFHDRVLRAGPVPAELLRTAFDQTS